METEDGDTVILDGVQNVDESLIEDFLRIISDRVLVGTVGEGEDAQLFEMPMNAFNLVLIDRGGGETYLIRNACDDQLAIDFFARGINPSATALETSDGGVLSLLSTFINQCAPDSGLASSSNGLRDIPFQRPPVAAICIEINFGKRASSFTNRSADNGVFLSSGDAMT